MKVFKHSLIQMSFQKKIIDTLNQNLAYTFTDLTRFVIIKDTLD